jgi:hypothetical protein
VAAAASRLPAQAGRVGRPEEHPESRLVELRACSS